MSGRAPPDHAGKKKGKTMSDEQKPMTAGELLAKGWELTEQSMALVGLLIPREIKLFQIDRCTHVRATRVAELDELAQAIGAIEEDIERLVQGAPALIFGDSDIEQLCQKKSALVELQKRAGRNGCPGSTTVIEALFPDIPVKKKTASEKAEIEQWLAIRKEAALKIDPETAEVCRTYVLDTDPYGVLDEWELPEEFHQIGSTYFARAPGSDIWVHFYDLPDTVRERIWAKRHSQMGLPPERIEDDDPPF